MHGMHLNDVSLERAVDHVKDDGNRGQQLVWKRRVNLRRSIVWFCNNTYVMREQEQNCIVKLLGKYS